MIDTLLNLLLFLLAIFFLILIRAIIWLFWTQERAIKKWKREQK